MKFSAVDMQAMLEALGEPAPCFGGTMQVVFQAPGSVFGGASPGIVLSEPTALAAVSDLAALGIDDGSYLTIDGREYQVVAPLFPDGSGFATLTLEAV